MWARFTDEESLNDWAHHSFGFHPGTIESAPKFEAVRQSFITLVNELGKVCPIQIGFFDDAISHLELAQMLAIKSIAVLNPLGPEQVRKT